MTACGDEVLGRIAEGGRMSPEEGLRLYRDAPTASLVRTAQVLRNRHAAADEVTYLVDRNVNYSNVCVTDCKFCEFYRPPGHHQGYVLSREALSSKLEELVAAGGTRVLLQGGHHPDLRIGWYEDLLSWIREGYPTLEIDGFSPSEIDHISQLEGLGVADVLGRLRAAGLHGVPGGGGEILDDEIRRRVSPKKIMTARWLEVMEAAHALDMYTSASQVIGFGEEPVHRIRSLENVRAQQDRSLERYGSGFVAFVSWPLLHESRFGRVFGEVKGLELGADDAAYLRHTAFARCYLDNIPHFQASWPTMGLDCARLALHHGCDDMGGTMMEENVVSQAGSVHCSVSEEEVRRTIEAAGFRPVKRRSRYAPADARREGSSAAPEEH
jgi:cyclic dehypoxanthinyl futalosine synthase